MLDDTQVTGDETYRVRASELRQFVEQIEAIDARIKGEQEAKKEVLAEAKGRGYMTGPLRKLIALRKRSKEDVEEEEAVLQAYKDALGHG